MPAKCLQYISEKGVRLFQILCQIVFTCWRFLEESFFFIRSSEQPAAHSCAHGTWQAEFSSSSGESAESAPMDPILHAVEAQEQTGPNRQQKCGKTIEKHVAIDLAHAEKHGTHIPCNSLQHVFTC